MESDIPLKTMQELILSSAVASFLPPSNCSLLPPAAVTSSRQVRTIVEEVQDGKVVSSREQVALTTR